MNIKPRIVRGLLRMYPAAWRAEYGQELEVLLLLRTITPSILADVARSAIRERLRVEPVWKICGAALFVFTITGIFVNDTRPPSQKGFDRYRHVWYFFVFMTGFLTVLRDPKASSALAGAKAALLGDLPEVVALILWALGIFHPMVTKAPGPYALVETRLALYSDTFPTPHPCPLWMIPLGPILIVAPSAIIGGLGGLLAWTASFFSTRLRPGK